MEKDKIAQYVADNMEYTPLKDIIVKPLPAIEVEKEFTEQIPTGEKDEEGFNKYETKTHTKKVESDFGLGIVIAIPDSTHIQDACDVKIGDTVVYTKKFAKEFDLFKDSELVKPYDIVAKKK